MGRNNNNNIKSSKGIRRHAQRGIGGHSFEEIQQKVAAIKAKAAVTVKAKKPTEATLEVLATPDQTPGPTRNQTRASSRSNSGCLDSSDATTFPASAHVSCLEAELNYESPRGSSSNFLEDDHLQVTGSEGTAAQPFAELSHKGGQQENQTPVDLPPEDKLPATSTTEADLPAKTTDDKLPKGIATVAVLPTRPQDDSASDTAPTDLSKAETLPDCHCSMSPSLMVLPVRQENAWSTPSQTSSPSVAPTECTKSTPHPQPRSWLASTALHTRSWVQAACTCWLGQPWAPKAVMSTIQLPEAAPFDLAAALNSAWHYQLLT